jgi:hypothetical protein
LNSKKSRSPRYQTDFGFNCERSLFSEGGVNSKGLAYDKESNILTYTDYLEFKKKQKSKEDIKLISDLLVRREVCFQKVRNSKGFSVYDKELKTH